MSQGNVWVVGHKNPDTDSICAAITYANLKNKVEERNADGAPAVHYLPKRAGSISAETAFVLDYFHQEAPGLVYSAGTQIKDITIRKTEGVRSQISIKKAWELMKVLDVVTLPVVDEDNRLEGIIVMGDIAKSYMEVYDNSILSKARTQYRNIVESIGGTMLTGNEHAYFLNGKVFIGAGSSEVVSNSVGKDDLVIVGNTTDSQIMAIQLGCACLVVTNGYKLEPLVMEAAVKHDVVVISTPYDTFTTARLITQSVPIRHFMTKDNVITFGMEDYLDDVKEAMGKIRHRDFPILDENQHYVGMFSRRLLMGAQKKQVILVDHNEKSQAIDHIEEAEILEIIDHHRIGSLETVSPVYFRNQPLGCTATIIYQMYLEQQIAIEPQIAGLLCAAILSDTLMFRSPTCTPFDKQTALTLAQIAGISVEKFAQQMFDAGSNFSNKTEDEILGQDFKIFHYGDVNFGVSQVSSMSHPELERLRERLQPQLGEFMAAKKLDMVFVMLTDILNESTDLIYRGEDADALVADAFDVSKSADGVFLPGVVSRKKQLIPNLMNAFTDHA